MRAETRPIERIARSFLRFTRLEAASGIALLLALAFALAWANSPWSASYFRLLEEPLSLALGPWAVSSTLHHAVNDALMTVFFFVVGLEIKRETVSGELRGLRRAAFPALAALGGMLVPALLYAACNWGRPSLRGWGIPTATDIPFALGILALLGKRVPGSVKIFLMALAIMDDLGAVAVIAAFYSGPIGWGALGQAGLVMALMLAFNLFGIRRIAFYVLPGALLWHLMQRSGIHGTIAGVLAAFAVPATAAPGRPGTGSPLQRLEDALHPWTSFLILPLFAWANAGVRFDADLAQAVAGPAGLGIALGLVVGKPLGIFGAVRAMLALGFPGLSGGAGWKHMLGAGMLGGIGFTMSVFISGLAFGAGRELDAAKAAVFLASTLAGLLGYAFLRFAAEAPGERSAADQRERRAR